MERLIFRKMHGLGNDFVVLDARKSAPALSCDRIVALADRRTGIGCDQLLVMEPSAKADVFMRIYNHDGSEASACGNGTRCIASLVMAETKKRKVTIETKAGFLDCHTSPLGIAIDLGPPSFDWRDVPLAEERNTLHLGLKVGALSDPVALSVGNPHAVFFVADAEVVDLARLGPKIETYFLFPDRVNVSVVQRLSKKDLRLRVWERGAGITRACGTAAVAALAAAHKRGLTGKTAVVHMDGGKLMVEWRADEHLILAGPVETSFVGEAAWPAPARKESVA
ncbi:MAG TPA: diaminopimelate epimerase [Sphingomonadales bacterium]|nr:diaminopimelate epimerase [Sphingomonadales bacterium]